MASSINSLEAIQKKIDAVKLFLSVSLSIANAHTVDFYTCDVWDQFMAVPPVEVLTEITLNGDHKRAPKHYLNHGSGTSKCYFVDGSLTNMKCLICNCYYTVVIFIKVKMLNKINKGQLMFLFFFTLEKPRISPLVSVMIVSAWWMWLSSWRLPMPTPCLASGSVWAAQSYCNPSDTLTTLNPWRKVQKNGHYPNLS